MSNARHLLVVGLLLLFACSDDEAGSGGSPSGTDAGSDSGFDSMGAADFVGDSGGASDSGAASDTAAADGAAADSAPADSSEDTIEADTGPGDDAPPESDAADADDGVDAGDLGLPPEPPDDAWPCDSPEYWPLTLESELFPLLVHYRPGEDDMAGEVLGYLETAWQVEVVDLGFTPPLPDDGLCGPDGRFDVYLWRDIIESYVDVIDENLDTEYDDWLSYMVVDPWGPYGGDILDATMAHEFNHACQAADDWFDSPIVFEMTATFMEDVVYDDDNGYLEILYDYQERPHWSFDRYDDYVTWYMYAAALYLHFVREHYFDGDASFTADMWRMMRNPPGAYDDPLLNEPDFEDALEALLQEQAGVGFLDSLLTFARWRWYTGDRDDGQHFEEGASFPEDASVLIAETVDLANAAVRVDIEPAPMMLGTAYAEVRSASRDTFELGLDVPDNDRVRWVVQAVPGTAPGSDGETLDLSSGSAVIELVEGARTLILSALPTGDDDPDERTDETFPVAILVNPVLE